MIGLIFVLSSFKASGHPMSFRHLPVPKTKINAFEPKALSPDVERQNMRATMLGATMAGNLKKIPCTDWAQMLFEALCFCFISAMFLLWGRGNANKAD